MPAFLPILRGTVTVACGLTLAAGLRGETPIPSPDSKDLVEQVRKLPVEDLNVINSTAAADLYGEARALASFRAASGAPARRDKKQEAVPPETMPGQKAIWSEWGLDERVQSAPLLPAMAAESMQETALLLRRSQLVGLPARTGGAFNPSKLVTTTDVRLVEMALRFKLADGVPEKHLRTLTQMLQAEPEPAREILVTLLASRSGAYASAALARLAVFDLSAKVRAAATTALKARPKEEFRKVLLEGVRYPWPAPAQHAAEALVALDDRAAVPELQELAALAAPTLPFQVRGGDTMLVREVIAVNHLRNCMLCHAPATEDVESLVAPVPQLGQPLPTAYYGLGSVRRGTVAVRADVTYLRQDFSVMLAVADAKPWPEMQRFDFLVRTRPATKAELEGAEEQRKAPYPQRESVLFAIKQLGAEALGAKKD